MVEVKGILEEMVTPDEAQKQHLRYMQMAIHCPVKDRRIYR